ncbi:MAG TPA: hypothetical protein VEL76_33695 [Gemmataceae bacterium]|nr:hypothetical protein [Gemmataceae bacterium]
MEPLPGSGWAGSPKADALLTIARLIHQVADKLIDALMIEENRDTPRLDENGHSVSHHQGVRIVNLKAIPVHQRYRKWAERGTSLEGVQRLVKAVRLHVRSWSCVVGKTSRILPQPRMRGKLGLPPSQAVDLAALFRPFASCPTRQGLSARKAGR